jgi:crotonobetainyl-CoA:carnitine CoA-transferase CaiB-like acyl-CoA transferase
MSVLTGIKVLELGRVPPAELPGMMFASFGANVIKIDTPSDPAALSDDDKATTRQAHTNRGKRSIAINLKTAAGQRVFARLAAPADVIVEGFRPGVTQRLNADYVAVTKYNSRVVYCSMSGFGQTGPYRSRPAHDLNFLALSGVLSLIRDKAGAPVIPLNLVADYGGASMHSALAIMLALFERERTGQGQYIDISYLETTVALLAATPNFRELSSGRSMPSANEGIFSGTYPYYTVYPTRDDRLLSVACSEPALWKNFCEAIGAPELAHFGRVTAHYQRQANEKEAKARLRVETILRDHTLAEWETFFEGKNVCLARVNSVPEMLLDSQVLDRNFVKPDSDGAPLSGPSIMSPLRLSRTAPSDANRYAPLPGADTEALLAEHGFSPSDVNVLKKEGAF